METNKIGSKIAEARKKMNISQAQLAQQVFVSAQAVGKWERGESIPDIITFNRLAKILGVDLNYFSDDFQDAAAETASAGSAVNEPADLAGTEQEEKLNWDMSRGNWIDADFSGLKDLHDKFSSSNMKNCRFIGSDLSGLLLKSNNADSCDFSDSDMRNSHIRNSHLVNNSFQDCSLKDAEFSGSHIKGCNFAGADLSGATFRSSSFRKNTMTNTVLKRTAFIGSDIADIVFEGTVENCSFENTSFIRVTFQNTTLINTFFKCRSLKRITFIDCQADRMTYEFLKNGKANLTGVVLLED